MIEVKETKAENLSDVRRLWADGDVMRFVGFPDGLIKTDEEMRNWYKWIESNRPALNHYSIFEDGKYCGESFYNIDREHKNAALDIKLFAFARGRGIAAAGLTHAINEAFQNGAETVWVDPVPENTKAVALYERLGFQQKDFPAYLAAEHEQYNSIYMERELERFTYITLREVPEIKDTAAEWFHSKWGVPKEAYLECMDQYLNHETEFGWYLCLCGGEIIGGMGVIENDFHDRKDLSPNVCAVYTDEKYRGRGIAGHLLNMVVEDQRAHGITPVYLVTDHTGFYERYGWEFLCMVQGDGEPDMTRMYIHR